MVLVFLIPDIFRLLMSLGFAFHKNIEMEGYIARVESTLIKKPAIASGINWIKIGMNVTHQPVITCK